MPLQASNPDAFHISHFRFCRQSFHTSIACSLIMLVYFRAIGVRQFLLLAKVLPQKNKPRHIYLLCLVIKHLSSLATATLLSYEFLQNLSRPQKPSHIACKQLRFIPKTKIHSRWKIDLSPEQRLYKHKGREISKF